MQKIPQAVAMVLLAGALACPLCSQAQETKSAGAMRRADARADAQRDIPPLLNEFLTHVADPAMHKRFWAEDLFYINSSGKRRTKAEVVKMVADAAAENRPDTALYSAEEVQVRQYGDVAVLNFRLVSKNGSVVKTFRNTGTLVNRHGTWQVVNWQATKVVDEKPAN